MDWELLKRLGREYWAPALVAAIWTIYSLSQKENGWTLTTVVNIFGPSFFLISWATAQIFRIKKQAQLERNLSGIENRLTSLVTSLEKQTSGLIGYSTGGNSLAYFYATHPVLTYFVSLDLLNDSEYPVFDFYSEVIDLDEPRDPNKVWTRLPFSVQSLYPKKVIPQAYLFDMSNRERLHLNVFIHTRTRYLTQKFLIVRVGERFHFAVKTECGKEVLERKIPDDFPGVSGFLCARRSETFPRRRRRPLYGRGRAARWESRCSF